MTFNIKAVVAAVALAASGSAFAAISDGSTGNGEGFLSVWDPASQTSYVRDLGIFMDDFGTANRPTGGFATNVDVAGFSFTSAADDTWAQFVAGKDTSGMVYDVLFLDSLGTSGADQRRYLVTSNNLTFPTVAGTQQNNNSITQFAIVNSYLNGVNQKLTGDLMSATFEATDAGYFQNFHQQDMGGNAKFLTTAAVGSEADFWYVTRSGSVNTAEAIGVQYANDIGAAKWLLAQDGTLTFTAAVPEPSTYAMLALGLVGIGAAVRRSRKA